MPLRLIERGAELLMADPSWPAASPTRGTRSRSCATAAGGCAYAGLAVEDLEPGEWRPLGHKELERLRRNVHLPPRP